MKTQQNFQTLPLAARLTIILFGVAGLMAALFTVLFQQNFQPRQLLILLPLTLITARAKVKLFRGSSLSLLTSVVLIAVIKEGPAVALLLGVCGVAVQTFFPGKKVVLHQLAFNVGMIAVTVAVTWWTHHMLSFGEGQETLSAETIATAFASFTYFLSNSISVSLIIALTKGISILEVWFHHFLYAAPSFLIAGFVSLGFVALLTTQALAIMIALVTVISIVYYCSVRLSAARQAS